MGEDAAIVEMTVHFGQRDRATTEGAPSTSSSPNGARSHRAGFPRHAVTVRCAREGSRWTSVNLESGGRSPTARAATAKDLSRQQSPDRSPSAPASQASFTPPFGALLTTGRCASHFATYRSSAGARTSGTAWSRAGRHSQGGTASELSSCVCSRSAGSRRRADRRDTPPTPACCGRRPDQSATSSPLRRRGRTPAATNSS